MESFLAALSPSVREELQRALDATPDGEARLRSHVAAYIDERGDWPTEPYTADYLARGFIHNASTFYWGGLNPRYGSAGIASTTAAALAGAALNLGTGQGAIILGNILVTTYGYEALSYALGLEVHATGTFIGIYNRIAATQDWRRLGFAAVEQNTFSQYLDSVLRKDLEREIRRNMTGLFANSAWRGARSALPHTDANTLGDRPQEVPWVENYVSRFINYQVENTSLVAKQVAAQGLERGEPVERLAARLKRTFGLSPRYAQAVDNYEMGLIEQKVPRGKVNTMVNRYVERLKRSRAETVTRTEAMSLFNLGRERKWQEAVLKGEMPIDTVKMWVTAKDELVCKVCRPMDGQTVALGESFYTRDGNVLVPAVHPNCRCLIIPVRNVADVSGAEFVFPVTEKVTKHLGGPSGKEDHPNTGSPQTVHNKGKGPKGFKRDKRLSTSEKVATGLAALLASAVARKAISPGVLKFNGIKTVDDFPKELRTRPASSWDDIETMARDYKFTIADDLDAPIQKPVKQADEDFDPDIDDWGWGEGAFGSEHYVFFRPNAYGHLQGSNLDDTLMKVEKFIKGKPVEHMFVMDDNGRIVAGFRGDEGTAPLLIPDNLTLAQRGRLTATHNHPSPTPYSGADLTAQFDNGVHRIRAVESSGNVSQMSFTVKNFDDLDTFVATHKGDDLMDDLFDINWEQSGWFDDALDAGNYSDEVLDAWEAGDHAVGKMLVENNQESYRTFVNGQYQRLSERWADYFQYEYITGFVKHMGGKSGDDPHPSGSPQSVHRGWDKALVELKPGAYDMPMDMLRGYIRGSGIRIGQKNRIRGLANSILENGFTKPITVWVYEDGPFIRDGMHRLEAAHLLGLPRIPVAIKHVDGNRPKSDIRGVYHGWRIRREGQLPKRDTPFRNVKEEDGFVRWFNERMAERGEQIAENPSAPPKRKRRSLREVLSKGDGPVLYQEFDSKVAR